MSAGKIFLIHVCFQMVLDKVHGFGHLGMILQLLNGPIRTQNSDNDLFV